MSACLALAAACCVRWNRACPPARLPALVPARSLNLRASPPARCGPTSAAPPSPQDERNIFLLASQLGVGPRCLVEFDNGRVEEFLPGENLTSSSMRRPEVSAAIATALTSFHVSMLARLPAARRDDGAGAGAGALQPAIYERIRRWHAAAAEVCSAELAQLGLANAPVEVRAAAGPQPCRGVDSWRQAQPSSSAHCRRFPR